MSNRKWLVTFVAGALLMAALPAGAGGRIPVSSTDNPGDSVANRTSAVVAIIVAMNDRLHRIDGILPPNPCTELPCPATDVVLAQVALAGSVQAICGGAGVSGGVAGLSTVDGDAAAEDVSATGADNQLAAVATVLQNANRRLVGIWQGRGTPTAAQATVLTAVYDAATAQIPEDVAVPPNPCRDLVIGG